MTMFTYKKICITNRHLVKGDFFERLEKVLQADVDMLILREKDLNEEEYQKLAISFLRLCEEHKKIAVLHTFADTAIKLSCPAIHLTFQDFINLSDQKKTQFRQIGVSTHTVEEAIAAQKAGASYITASPIFETDCKKGVPGKGLSYLQSVVNAVGIDVYALGGINQFNYEQCLSVGAAGICMMSEYMGGDLTWMKERQ